ncbi:hypothetical protein ON010_g8872 [Phytophthora cinnamomi]|nr:hypothetical protein ON010_g8872 [Phytophthora cinnamomi]
MVSTKDSLQVQDCAFVVNSQCADSTRDCEIIDIRSLRHKTCSASELVAREDLNLVDDKETLLQRGQNVPKHQPSGPVKLKYLNGLRGVASLLVVHIHASYLRELTIAPSSVDVFFVLSAFLLTMQDP